MISLRLVAILGLLIVGVAAGASLAQLTMPPGTIQMVDSSGKLVASSCVEGPTVITCSKPIEMVGPGPSSFSFAEGKLAECPKPTAGLQIMCADAARHAIRCSKNGGAYGAC
jgi:hypothetical protein